MASRVPEAVRRLLGLSTPIPGANLSLPGWEGRLREAAYTSPGGTRIPFAYEDVGRGFTKRTAPFEFPLVDGAYIQDNGIGARKYPLRCIFSGDNCDLTAAAFEALLIERGEGRLEHPLYGKINVVPVGDITRRDDLKTAANQAIVEATFWSSLGTVYPRSQGSPRNEILAALDGFNVAAAQQFAGATSLTSTVAKVNAKNTVLRMLKTANAAFSNVTAVNTAIAQEFRDVQQAINFGIDVLIGQPLLLAQQMLNMLTLPARANIGIADRLSQYLQFARNLMASPAGVATPADATILSSMRQRLSNDFHTADLNVMGAVSGSVLATLETQFDTRPEAISAADSVTAMFDEVNAWRESRFDGLSQVDLGASYQALQHAVALVSGHLVQASFELVPERRIVLDRERTIVDLAAELYGSVDDKLDLLISTNDLSASEILELPRGRMVKYYA